MVTWSWKCVRRFTSNKNKIKCRSCPYLTASRRRGTTVTVGVPMSITTKKDGRDGRTGTAKGACPGASVVTSRTAHDTPRGSGQNQSPSQEDSYCFRQNLHLWTAVIAPNSNRPEAPSRAHHRFAGTHQHAFNPDTPKAVAHVVGRAA